MDDKGLHGGWRLVSILLLIFLLVMRVEVIIAAGTLTVLTRSTYKGNFTDPIKKLDILKGEENVIGVGITCIGETRWISINRIATLNQDPLTNEYTFWVYSGADYVTPYSSTDLRKSWKKQYTMDNIPKKYNSVFKYLLENHEKEDWPEPAFQRVS